MATLKLSYYQTFLNFTYINGGPGIKTKSFQETGWLKLDNAAKLFPAISSEELTSVFRITATLAGPVRYSALKEAVEVTSKRFPYFSVSLGSGLFWHFLEFHDQAPRIHLEEKIPCTAFAINRKNELLYRILVRSNRISVEFIHILTDGSGAFEFMKSLLHTYLGLTGNPPDSSESIMSPGSPINEEETEDGYNKYFRKLPPPDKLTRAWHLPFSLNKKPRLKVIQAEIPVAQLLETARNSKVSITEYFVSVFWMILTMSSFVITIRSETGFDRTAISRVFRIRLASPESSIKRSLEFSANSTSILEKILSFLRVLVKIVSRSFLECSLNS